MEKSILIICYTFPPFEGIGGRRWAKFAKYLAINNKVFVVASNDGIKNDSEWSKDIITYKENIRYIDSGFPMHLTKIPRSFIEKLLYRYSLFKVKLFSHGNYYDRGSFWKKKLLTNVEEIIKENKITHLICSVGPFKSAYYLLELKEKHPQIKFIVDYRDPWTNNKTSFGYENISRKRLKYELDLEKKVVQNYDQVWVVANDMSHYYKQWLKMENISKIKFLPNGFDTDDFRNYKFVSEDKKRIALPITIVFAGTFYNKSIHVFENLANLIIQNKETYKGKLVFNFVGSVPQKIIHYFNNFPDFFKFHGKKNLHHTYQMISQADFCALFLTDDLDYSFSTKFYEYIAMKKPIISFSKMDGVTGEFIFKNKIGLSFHFQNIAHEMDNLINGEYFNFLNNYNPSIDTNHFTIQYLTSQMEEFLQQ